MKNPILPLLTFAGLAPLCSAATVTFAALTNYDNNFLEVGNPGNVAAVATNGGILSNTGGAATSAIYNTTATNSGTPGAGGTTVTPATYNLYTNVRVSMDLQINSPGTLAVNGNSMGFYTKLNSSGAAGYLAVMRVTGAGTADLRIWEAATTVGAGTGTIISGDATNGIAFTGITGTPFALGTAYNMRLDVEDVGATVRFRASIWDAAGTTQYGNTVEFIDTTGITGAGQVGLRLGSNMGSSVYYDNFILDEVPEPAATVLGALGFAALLLRKRK